MPRLPVTSGAQAVKAFERAGWHVDRQRGSHVVMLKAGHIASLSIPQHKTWSSPNSRARAACRIMAPSGHASLVGDAGSEGSSLVAACCELGQRSHRAARCA